MRCTARIIEEARSLPVEERAVIIDSLLSTLNHPDSDIDSRWGLVAKRRLEEMRSGKVRPVPGEEVFARIYDRYAT